MKVLKSGEVKPGLRKERPWAEALAPSMCPRAGIRSNLWEHESILDIQRAMPICRVNTVCFQSLVSLPGDQGVPGCQKIPLYVPEGSAV